MELSTEDIRRLRDQYVFDRKRLIYSPQKVYQNNERIIAILNELLEFREACDIADGQINPNDVLFGVPLEGTVG